MPSISHSASDIHRPSYHFLPAANWMNDPNGVIQWHGRYHLFFQYNPDGAYHANMHWGHAVSDDLLHWQELPVAIAPTPNSPDQGGIFSGCVVNDQGRPTAFYTGVNGDYSVQVQCLARGNHDLTRWQKYADNPVIGTVPAEMGQTRDFRDPFVFQHAGLWYMCLASHIVGVGGAVLLYRSANLTDWDYCGPLYVGESARSGWNFECPNFFPLGDKWVLLVSIQLEKSPGYTIYFVGRFEDERFIPEREGLYDAGYSYASLCHADESGRWLVYSWLREGRSVDKQLAAGWSGVQAIPRVLSLDADKRLISAPVPELQSLRRARQHFTTDELLALDDAVLPTGGFALDIDATFDASAAPTCGIEVARAPDGQEKTAVFYERGSGTLRIQRCYRQADSEIDSAPLGLPHALDADEPLQLRILLDGSVLEIIANGRSRITSRIYPTDAANQSLRLINPAAATDLQLWRLAATG